MSQIICGDSAEALKDIPDDSIDCIATDPPYGISFMGRSWDDALPPKDIWLECFRVLKPGGIAFVMAIARTDCFWRMARDLEGAGFDVSLQPILWCYNQGFPKALDISKSFDKAAFRSWAKPLMDSNAELRKATSAAVNGGYYNPLGRKNIKSGVTYSNGSLGMRNPDRTEGTTILAALIAEHWEPLSEQEKLEAWRPYCEMAREEFLRRHSLKPWKEWKEATEGKGGTRREWERLRKAHENDIPLTDDGVAYLRERLSLPPGVRVKVGSTIRPPGKYKTAMATDDIPSDWSSANPFESKTIETNKHTVTAPSVDLAREWDGWKSQTGLKPAYELVIVARKPMSESPIRDNVAKHGTGAYNIDAGRVPFSEDQKPKGGYGGMDIGVGKPGETQDYTGSQECDIAGRFPANLISSGGAMGEDNRYYDLDRWAQEHGFATDETWLACAKAGLVRCPKPSKSEKDAGLDCEERPVVFWQTANGTSGEPSSMSEGRKTAYKNDHPCTKPVSLFAWLLSIGCPPDGTVLDPFAGSGTTGVAAAKLGRDYILIDQDRHYCDIAEARVAHAEQEAEQGSLL